MNPPNFSIERPVAVSILTVGIMLLGVVSLQKIPLNLLPDITYPKITIRTEYPHAAPREVEERVTKFIESAVGIIQNVVKVSSVSRPGWSDVYLEFRWGTDLDVAAMDIREKLQLIENFLPEEVERPLLLRYDPNQDPIVTLAVGGEGDLAELRRWVEMNMELELERLEGVAAVKVEGGFEDEVMIELDEEKLSRFGLSVAAVSDRLRRENVNLASGSLEEGGTKLAVRTVNRFTSLEDIAEVIISEGGKPAISASSVLPAISIPAISSMGGFAGAGFPGGLAGMLAGLGGLGQETAAAAGTPAPGAPAVIRIKDIAAVKYQHKERTEIARLNGKECVKVSVYKEGDANIVTVARAVQKAVEEIKQRYRAKPRSPEWERELKSPRRSLKKAANLVCFLLLNRQPFTIPEEPLTLERGIEIAVISDQSRFIINAIMSVAQNAVIGSLFAVFVLYLFLRNWSSTMIVGIAIPVSFIATFNLMYFRNISFNIMSLGGLALGVGVLVDNSIIVIENILRHRTFEPDLKTSARRATGEMVMPVITGSLTNIIVFFPILYLEGMFRAIFSDLAWTVAFSTMCSAVAAITLVPMLSVALGKRVRLPEDLLKDIVESGDQPLPAIGGRPADGPEPASSPPPARPAGCWWFLLWPVWMLKLGFRVSAAVLNGLFRYPLAAFDRGFGRLRTAYPAFLRRLLKRPFLVSAISVAVGVGSVGTIVWLGWELFPPVDEGEFYIRLKFPSGTPIEQTSRRISGMEEKIRRLPEGTAISDLFATAGISTGEGAGVSEKAENIGEIHVALKAQRELRDEAVISAAMSALSDEVEALARSAKPQLLSYKTPIEIEVEGHDLDRLKAAAEQIVHRLQGLPGLQELETSMGEQNPEVVITIDRARASTLGLSVTEITDVVRRKVKGEIPTRFDLPDQQLDIVLQLEPEDRASLERLRRLTVPGPNGEIQLSQIAEIKPGLGPAAITRVRNSRVALIQANLHGRPLGDVVADIHAALADLNLPPDCSYRITGQNEEMQRSLPSLYLALALAVILVYVLLAAEFESLTHPFIIMFCVPFSLVGLAFILLLSGQTINMSTLIGILMMIGILDNVGIVLISAINLNRDYGMERLEAIVEAARTRLRPILITNLTTILGMVPMAVAWGPGTELSAPMAIAVIGGLSSATILTLLAIPCLYLTFDTILPRSYTPHKPLEENGGSETAASDGQEKKE